MPEIKVKTEWVEKLKQLGVYDKWIANIQIQFGQPGNRPDRMISWMSFINWSFCWSTSIEGTSFWKEIYET